MNTNLNWLSEATGTAVSVVNQIQSWPSAVLLTVFLIILGGTLKVLKLYPNKFIPTTLMLGGGTLNLLLGDPGKVDPSQRFPDVILCLQGIVVAFGACLFHALVLKRLEKHVPIFQTNGDTAIITKPKDET